MLESYSLFNVLDQYGFSTIKQKNSLQYMLQKAKIIQKDQAIQDKFTDKQNYEDLVLDILEFVTLTQENFSIRKGHQERWHVQPKEWMKQDTSEIYDALQNLGFISATQPKALSPDAVCVLGATMPTMQNRLNYTVSIVEKDIALNNLILLTGERYATTSVDASEEELNKIATNNNLTSIANLTETHLFEALYKNSSLYNKIPTYIIDTPARNLPRPTTQSTIVELVDWLKNYPEINSISFVSNQPFVKYQEAIISETFRSLDFDLNFEVIGDNYQSKDLQSSIEALGAYIYASTPGILTKYGKKISNPLIIDSLTNIYSKQPLIFHNLEHIFANNCSAEITGSSPDNQHLE